MLCELSRVIRDTAVMFESLQRLEKLPGIDQKFHYWAAEIRLIKEGNPSGLVQLVKKDSIEIKILFLQPQQTFLNNFLL